MPDWAGMLCPALCSTGGKAMQPAYTATKGCAEHCLFDREAVDVMMCSQSGQHLGW